MIPSIRKELRLLAMPAGFVIAATLAAACGASWHGPVRLQFFQGLIPFAFFLGTPLVAASSFGAEFHHRTMTLLLTEPVTRGRVWMGKVFSVVAVLGVLAAFGLAAFELASLKTGGFPPQLIALLIAPGAMFVVMVVCSAPLWTLLARSEIGGVVLTLTGVMTLELASNYVWSRITGTVMQEPVFGRTPVLEGVRAAYSLATLWLGWRVFSRFQAAGAGFGGSSAGSRATGWAFLRSRRGDAIGNLVRKELMLQRPTFLVAAVFVACWLVGLLLIQPATSLDETVVFTLLGVYVPLMMIGLAGIISVGEDSSLAIRAWHLTLPVSTRRQWAIKLVVSLLVGLVLALALPALLGAVANIAAKGHVVRGDFFGGYSSVVAVVTGGVVLGFWASTLLRDTVKAAAGTVAAVFLLGLVSMNLGRWLGELVGQADWLVRFVTALNMPPRLRAVATSYEVMVALFIAVVCIPALWQSLVAFRRVHLSRATTIRMALTLLAVGFLTAFGYFACGTALWRVH